MAEQLYKGNKTLMPLCVATYQRGHEQCDGKPSGETEQDQMACVYRDRCIAMGIYGRSNRLERSQLIQLVRARGGDGQASTFAVAAGDDDELQKAVSAMITRCKIKDGIAAYAPLVTQGGIRPANAVVSSVVKAAVTKAPHTVKKPGASRGKLVPNVEGRKIVEEIGDHYQHNVLSRLGRTMATSQGEAEVGQFFMVDRRSKSGYCSLYMKAEDGSRMAVTSMYFRPNNGVLEVRVACDYKAFVSCLSTPNKLKLEPEDYTGRDGCFKVRFHRLDKGGAALVAEALDRAVRAGILELPTVVSGRHQE
jgi:hypothetical protein